MRAAANEWGNLTIMGDAYISENAIAANTATPNASNYANMEGLTAASPTDTTGGPQQITPPSEEATPPAEGPTN